jgi:hypothetical protein
MDRPEHNNADFFVGVEVERTPAYGQRTLFVVGPQDQQEILSQALNNGCAHIYLGANHSFAPKDEQQWQQWHKLINGLLTDGIWVTLDYDVSLNSRVLERGYQHFDNFIAMISVKLAHIREHNYNASVKLDDSDFKHSNPGVWVHSLHELQTRNTFTDWSRYDSDTVIDKIT